MVISVAELRRILMSTNSTGSEKLLRIKRGEQDGRVFNRGGDVSMSVYDQTGFYGPRGDKRDS